MKKIPFKSEKPILFITWLSIVMTAIGFYGLKIVADKAPIPDVGWLKALVGLRVPFLILGILLFFGSVFVGNVVKNGRFHLGDFLPYLFILPAIACLVLFVLYPLINLIYLSLFRGSILRPTKSFVGWGNFKDTFTDVGFIAAVKNTATYTFAIVVLQISLALLLAVWFFKDHRLNHFAQLAVFTPHLIASISVAFVWGWMFNYHSYGVINTILGAFNIPPVPWLESSKTALACIIVVNVWKGMGYYSILLLSSMKSIPVELYEAAELDGSSPAKTFFKITFPMLTPQLFFLLITITIGSFKVFDSINIMTDGGPGRATEVLTRIIYDYAIHKNNMLGISAAISVVFVILLCFLSFLYFHFLDRKVHYQ